MLKASAQKVAGMPVWMSRLLTQSFSMGRMRSALLFLGRNVRAGRAKSDATGSEMAAQSVVIKLLAIVRLKSNKRELKLSAHICMKLKNVMKSIRLGTQWKCPNIVCAIINQNEIVLITRKASHRRGPNISMNKLKRNIGH